MAKRKAESISTEEPSTLIAGCEIGPSPVATNCRNKNHEGEAVVTRVDTRGVSGCGDTTQVAAWAGVANEALSTGFHVAPADAPVPVHTRYASAPPVPVTEPEWVDEQGEALKAFGHYCWKPVMNLGEACRQHLSG